ncbi:MAG TPA: methyltransferase domain-containing protein [Alphaproteobacteria bacterium]|nr:methyltransferase domain-containing protein [Alphaproteobacteria bacterium]
MYSDIVDLREFYLSPLGQTVQRLLRARLSHIWPQVKGEKVLALGYGTPILRPLLGEAASLIAMMPAAQGVAYWPREGPNLSSLVDVGSLPLADGSVDRVILVHAVEGSADPQNLLREIWRVLKSNGRALVIVPNRRGLWAHSDRTPFGNGQPYSATQIKQTLRDQGFLVDRMWRGLYLPPSQSRVVHSIADFLEKYGEKIFPGFGGLLMLEAGKQLYAPMLTKSRPVSQRLVLPLPMPVSPTPLPG